MEVCQRWYQQTNATQNLLCGKPNRKKWQNRTTEPKVDLSHLCHPHAPKLDTQEMGQRLLASCKQKWQTLTDCLALIHSRNYQKHIISWHSNISTIPEWIEAVDIFKRYILITKLWNWLLNRPPTKSIDKEFALDTTEMYFIRLLVNPHIGAY